MNPLSQLFALLAPDDCLACGSEGRLVCDWCFPDVIQPVVSRCFSCHARTPHHLVCSGCRTHTALQYVWIAGSYEGVLQQLVYRYKFERAQHASKLLARILDDTLPCLPAETLITYVPTASSRIRQRGYDHARELAMALGRLRNISITPLFTRHGHKRQVGASRRLRLGQAAEAYRLMPATPVKGMKVLIIDDIATTGATLTATANLLKEAGAAQVFAAVVAQKQ